MKPQLASTLFRAPFSAWTPAELLAYFQQRDAVRYFPIVDETQSSRAQADQVLLNCFDFNEEVYELGGDFDWMVNPSADVEWLILLHKFYYATGLGIAYQETKDPRYAEKWIELTDGWIADVPLDFLPSDVAGRRIQNWISAYYFFVRPNRTPCLPPDFHARFLHSLHRQVTHLKANLTPARNHRTLELWAIFFAAIVFPEFNDAAGWLAFARQELLCNAQTDLLTDGVQCELSTDYHHIVLRNFLYVIRLARMNEIKLPEELHRLVRGALEFSLYSHKPDGFIPALSDSDTGSYLQLLKQGHEFYGDETMLYAATKGREGVPPARRSRGFEQSGYYILRSGWGEQEPYEDERYLIFDCGPLGAGNHGHLDLLSFEMAAYGKSLVIDPGRYTYYEPSLEENVINWRVLFRGTSYHNTVVVDGRNQTRYEFHKRKFKIKGNAPEHELKAFVTRDGLDYLHGVARSREYDAAHERRIVFAASEYWLVSDLLLAGEQHDYDLLFHLSDRAHGKTTIAVERETVLIDAPDMVMAQVRDPKVTALMESGFVSPTYGIKWDAPIARFAQRAADACFHTILFPYKTKRPTITVEKLAVFSSGRLCPDAEASASCVTIMRDEQCFKDHFLFVHQPQGKSYQCGEVTFQGAFLYFRKNLAGELLGRHEVKDGDVRGASAIT